MKRKTKTGVKLLSQVIERMSRGKKAELPAAQKSNGPSEASSQEDGCSKSNMYATDGLSTEEKEYIYPLLYIYRAYGYIVLEEYDKGLKDFLKSS